MATLILTAVGTAVGGPIGGALGALAGQALDARLFAPKGREGPRLTELAVQTSSYGAPIPKLFGTMRIAGTVIWSTDLIEHASTTGGGKRQPSTTSYAYSASFAVLLSARAIRSVGRIWADGTLLRGAAGDFKAATNFRLYLGNEAQAPDPLIASAEGIGLVPACRGQAYAVFEDLPLADFGNRIPALTFEVVADEGMVTCGAIAAAISGGAIVGDEATMPLVGYSAYGDSIRSVSDGLVSAGGAWIATEPDALVLRSGDGVSVALPDMGAGDGHRRARSIAPADTAPRTVSVQYHDPARDYQAGLQRVRRAGAGSRELRIELPAVLDAGAAKTLAAATLTRADVARERRSLSLDWRACGVVPGDRVVIAGEAGLWRVVDWSLEAMVLTLDLARVARAPLSTAGTPGRVIGAPDALAGATLVHAFECPSFDDTILQAPRLTIAAGGTGSGWRSAALQMSLDGGARWVPVGTSRGRATLGHLASAPGPSSSTLVDRVHSFDVVLAHAGMTLSDADDGGLDAGANLAIVGDELLQFGRAVALGGARWRLSRLWRGRRGTEWAAGTAAAGDRFVLLDPATLLHVDLPASAIGGTATVMATGAGDTGAAALAAATVRGDSVAPPSPAHLIARVGVDGALNLRWVRRSRGGWHWSDAIEAPLVEESEVYMVDAGARSPALGPSATLAAGQWESADMAAVRQLGTHGASRAVRVTITGMEMDDD